MTPNPRELYSAGNVTSPGRHTAPSTWAAWAARALARVHGKAPGVLEVLCPASGQTPRSLQHKITALTDETDSLALIATLQRIDDPHYPWRRARYHSNCGDAFSLNTMPSDSHTTYDNADFEVTLKRRLLIPIYNCTIGESLVCPKCKITAESGCVDKSGVPKLDLFGNHATCCSSASGGPRREFWHDKLVSMWGHLARFAGFSVSIEQDGIVVGQPQLRADLYLPQMRMILDQRTAVTCEKSICAKAASYPGAAAEAGTTKKEDKWKTPVEAQGDIFLAPVIEEGGRINQSGLDLIDMFARRFGDTSTERDVFTTYALQHIHVVNQIGVAKLCRAVQPVPLGPRHMPLSSLRMGVPTQRPVGTALSFNASAPRPEWQANALHKLHLATAVASRHPAPSRSPFASGIQAPSMNSPQLTTAPLLALAPSCLPFETAA